MTHDPRNNVGINSGADMKWTTDVPTEPGWYWYRDSFVKPEIWQIFGHETQLLPLAEWWPDPIDPPESGS